MLWLAGFTSHPRQGPERQQHTVVAGAIRGVGCVLDKAPDPESSAEGWKERIGTDDTLYRMWSDRPWDTVGETKDVGPKFHAQ